MIEDLYIVEEKEHTMTINNKKLYHIDYHFFVNKKDASNKSKQLRDNLYFKSYDNKIRAFKLTNRNFFKWFTIDKHSAITQGIPSTFYSLRGELNKINDNTGNPIFIEKQFNEEEGKKIKEYLEDFLII